MKVFNINDFRAFHPDMVGFRTDVYYLNIANVLYGLIGKSMLGREMEFELKCESAMTVALYFEDVVCDLGIWRAFTEIHAQRYGHPLPFYSLDEIDEYYPDEIHMQDIQFLLWNVMQSAYDDRFMNPENPGIEELARMLYVELDKRFEQAPINEQYKVFAYEMIDANNPNAPFLLRNIWSWLLTANYLVMNEKVDESIQMFEESMSFIGDSEKINYTAMSNACMKLRFGPLNLTATKWYAAMCKGEESENARRLAQKMNAMDYREVTIYKIISCGSDSVKIESPNGEVLEVPFSGFAEAEEVKVTASKNTTVISAFIRWDNEWLPFGMTSWGENEEGFAEKKEEVESNRRTAKFVPAKVKEKFGEQRLFFLKNEKQIGNWYKELYGKEIPMDNSSDNCGDWPDDEPIAIYLDDMGDFCISPIARAIASNDNPYYDPMEADLLGLCIIMDPDYADYAFTDYLVDNNLLPDAACNSLQGPEHGRELIQSNICFLKEYFRGIR